MCGSCSNTYCPECGKPVYMRNCDHCKEIDDNEGYEDTCCDSMKIDYTGKCIMCGDTSARIEVEGEKKCCENEDRTVWGDCVSCGDVRKSDAE